MVKLRIYLDLVMSEKAERLLREGTAEHQLLFPSNPAASVLSCSEPDPLLKEADVAFGQPEPAMIAQSRRLRWLHVSSSSITRYDTAQFRGVVAARKFAVTNSASVYSEACAVHTMAFMLSHARQLPRSLTSIIKNGSAEWLAMRDSSRTLTGESVIIVGFGAIGQRLVELLAPFQMRIVACRRNARGDEPVPVIGHDQLREAMRSADHVINILPDSPKTRGFFDAERLGWMNQAGVFYNIGRGITVDQEALCRALHEGKMSAAWLDVTEPEPLPENHPLRKAPNCYITPHIAGGHREESVTLVGHFLDNLQRFTRNQPLKDRVM